MTDLIVAQPLNAITDSQIAELTANEMKEIAQNGSPNWMTLQSMVVELSTRLDAVAPTLEVPSAA